MPDNTTLEQQLEQAVSGEPEQQSQPQQTSAPAPDAGGAQQQATQTTAAPSQPSSQPSTPSAPPTPAAVPEWRRMANEYGMQLPDNVDEGMVLKHLFQGTATAQRLQRQLAEITPHFSEFQKWQATQQAAEAAKKTDDKPWHSPFWNPPEFDQSWKQQITKDLDGNLIPAQGAPPDIVNKYLTHEQFRVKQAEQFMQNPHEYMKASTEYIAEQKARAVYEEMHRQQSEQQFISSTVTSPEMKWIYQQDEKGNVLHGMDGQPLMSDLGNVYRSHVQAAYQKGWSVEDQHQWGLAKAQAEYYVSDYQKRQQVGAPSQREQANERLHLRHEHAPNVSGVIPGPADGLAPPPNTPGLDLRDQLTLSLQGETDESVNDYRFNRRTA